MFRFGRIVEEKWNIVKIRSRSLVPGSREPSSYTRVGRNRNLPSPGSRAKDGASLPDFPLRGNPLSSDVELKPDAPADRWVAGLEAALTLLLGLSLPLAAFPVAVWRGFEINLPHLFAGALLITAAVGIAARRRPWPPRRFLLAAGGIAASCALGWVLRGSAWGDSAEFTQTGVHLLFMLAVFLVLSSPAFRPAALRRLLVALVLESLLMAAYGYYQLWALRHGLHSGIGFLSRFSARPLRISGYLSGAYRATSFFEEPSWFGNYLLDSSVFAYGLWLFRRKEGGVRNRLWLLASAFLLATVVTTGSLGAIVPAILLAAVLSVDVLIRSSARPSRKALAAAALIAAAVGFGWAVARSDAFAAIRKRIEISADLLLGVELPQRPEARFDYLGLSGSAYLVSAEYSLCLWKTHPVFGVGLGHYRSARKKTPECSNYRGTDPWTGLAWCAETGTAGFLAALFLLGSLVLPPRRRARAGPGEILARLLVVVFLLKQSHTGSYLNLASWYPLGLAAAAITPSLRREGGPS